jgi:hypothetical protein
MEWSRAPLHSTEVGRWTPPALALVYVLRRASPSCTSACVYCMLLAWPASVHAMPPYPPCPPCYIHLSNPAITWGPLEHVNPITHLQRRAKSPCQRGRMPTRPLPALRYLGPPTPSVSAEYIDDGMGTMPRSWEGLGHAHLVRLRPGSPLPCKCHRAIVPSLLGCSIAQPLGALHHLY